MFFIRFSTTSAPASFDAPASSFDTLPDALEFLDTLVCDFIHDGYPGHTIIVYDADNRDFLTFDYVTYRSLMGR